jgi:hypothetical protein
MLMVKSIGVDLHWITAVRLLDMSKAEFSLNISSQERTMLTLSNCAPVRRVPSAPPPTSAVARPLGAGCDIGPVERGALIFLPLTRC